MDVVPFCSWAWRAPRLFYTLFGVATVWRSLAWLFVARIGAGIAGATISTAQAYIADTTSAANRTKGMALIGAAFALGFTLGPVIGAAALLVGTTGDVSPWPGYFAAGLSGTALLLALWLLPESKTPQSGTARRGLLDLEGLRVALTTSSIGLLLLTSFIVVFSLAAFESTLSLEIKTLHDRALVDPAHQRCTADRHRLGPGDSVTRARPTCGTSSCSAPSPTWAW